MSFEAIYSHDGHMVDYTPGSDVAAGEVIVQGDLVGIAKNIILTGILGALGVSGVWDVVKATITGSAFTAGVKVYWDAANNIATTTAGANKQMGYAVQAAAEADTTVRVLLVQVN